MSKSIILENPPPDRCRYLSKKAAERLVRLGLAMSTNDGTAIRLFDRESQDEAATSDMLRRQGQRRKTGAFSALTAFGYDAASNSGELGEYEKRNIPMVGEAEILRTRFSGRHKSNQAIRPEMAKPRGRHDGKRAVFFPLAQSDPR